jgi:predicted MPP superfamily phosphohydrolase
MAIAIIHLSDIHYLKGRPENHGVVLDSLFKDIKAQKSLLGDSKFYLAISGDIVQAGDSVDQFDEFFSYFEEELKALNIPKSHRICTPGNHDISRNAISKSMVEHEGIVSQAMPEAQFNDYISTPSNLLFGKFKNYLRFENIFAELGIGGKLATGAGWDLPNDIGVYCLNTALCSSGGLASQGREPKVDKGKLAVDTRRLHDWARTSKARWKILVMHHPIEWLCDWAQTEVKTIIQKHFTLCLSGHTHDQETYHRLIKGSSLVECSAPPLFTDKKVKPPRFFGPAESRG